MSCFRVVSALAGGFMSLTFFVSVGSSTVADAKDNLRAHGYAYERGGGVSHTSSLMRPLSRQQQTRVMSEARVRESVRRADAAFAWPPYSAAEKRAVLRGYPVRAAGGWSRGGWSGAGYGGVTPIVLPNTVDTTPSAYSSTTGVRSIVDIPAVTGIRAAPVGEPVLYRIETHGRATTVTPSSGPRIITLSEATENIRTLGNGAWAPSSSNVLQVRPN
jgi:hypothetical protein